LYDYLDEKRHALDLWGARLKNIVEVRAPKLSIYEGQGRS
jgi:hypothetical protein